MWSLRASCQPKRVKLGFASLAGTPPRMRMRSDFACGASRRRSFEKGERSDDMTHGQAETTYFPHERLVAWELALEALELVAGRREKLRGLPGGMAGQLEPAVAGAYSNLCAGAAAREAEARRHFRIALSEAGEAGGCARGTYALGALAESKHAALRAMLLRLCTCLRGLTR